MKKSEELKAKINELKKTAQNCITAKDVGGAKKAMVEIEDTKILLDAQLKLEQEEEAELNAGIKNKQSPVRKNAVSEFAFAARRGFKATATSMSEGTLADGGYTVPEEISTMINEYRDSKFSLLQLVEVVPVSTKSGARTFKKRSQQTGFSLVAEGGAITQKQTPQFERQEWSVKKYAGYFPVTNELLADSDANITNTLVQWIGDESRVTANTLILTAIGTKAQTEFETLDDIKKALNVTLGQAFKNTSSVITNDDGLQYLDTLKDGDGKYLLQPSPQNPMQLRLCAGATTIPVVVVPNSDLPTTSNKIPFIVGDLKEAVTYFDRQHMTITTSDVAVAGTFNAFENDLTLFRAIEREDVKVKDVNAFVNGYIDVTP